MGLSHPGRILRAAVWLAGIGLALPAAAQLAPRPDSRPASFPTAPTLPPPLPIRFDPAWERETDPATGERIAQLASTGGVVWSLSESGQLAAWDGATGEPIGADLNSSGAWDPASPLVTACGALLGRLQASGTLMLLAGGAEPAAVLRIAPVGLFEGGADTAVFGAWSSLDGSGTCRGRLSARNGASLLLIDPVDGHVEKKTLSAPAQGSAQAAGGRQWVLAGDPDARLMLPLGPLSATSRARTPRPGSVPHAVSLGSSGPGARRLAVAGDAWMGSFDSRSGRRQWEARTPTGAGPPPIVVTTRPGPGSRTDPETLLVVGTLDGDLIARREDNGHLAWSSRAAGRLTRPIARWEGPETPGDPDRLRLLAAADGSRRLEAFRAIDGAPAGALQVGTDTAVILAGPVLVRTAGETRCVIAWRPWAGGPSRLLSLRLL